MTQQLIVTTPANTGTGDSPKAAFDKINANFSDLYNNSALSLVYTPPFSGATPTTIATKFSQVLSVFDFMTAAQIADSQSGAGNIDATAAIQAAHNSLGANGGAIFFPAGAYLVSSVTISKECFIFGAGASSGGSLIKPKNTASVVFDLTGSAITIRDIAFNPFSNTQTGGAFIKCDTTSAEVRIEDVFMYGWYIGIWLAGISDFMIRNCRLEAGVPTNGIGVWVTSGIAMELDTILCTNAVGFNPKAGIQIDACGDITMNWCQWLKCQSGCFIDPGAGGAVQVAASVYAINSFFDTCGTYGLAIQPQSANGTAQRMRFTSCWFSSAGTSGILLDSGTNGGNIDGIEFVAPQVYLNGSHGVNVVGANTVNFKVTGGGVTGNGGDGILIQAGVGKFDITDCCIGPTGSIVGNTSNAIQILAGTSSNFHIVNNRLTGNGGTIADGSTGTNRWKTGNIGYNPVGTNAITVTASPFTYTAGDAPETVYINGGTVSQVTVGGVNSFSQTNCAVRLGPGTAVVVTYSALPGMATSKD